MSDTFDWWETTLRYCTHPYNDARRNERAVEVPIASSFVDAHRVRGIGLEVGNVLSHYRDDVDWPVVDLYEEAPGVLNMDLFDWHHHVDWIVSVSTVEHTGVAVVDAIEYLASWLRPGGAMLVTAPMGANSVLDGAIAAYLSPWRACTLVREGDGWVQSESVTWLPYGGAPGWAASVWIAEFLR